MVALMETMTALLTKTMHAPRLLDQQLLADAQTQMAMALLTKMMTVHKWLAQKQTTDALGLTQMATELPTKMMTAQT
jgi:hypothetical protein